MKKMKLFVATTMFAIFLFAMMSPVVFAGNGSGESFPMWPILLLISAISIGVFVGLAGPSWTVVVDEDEDDDG